MSECWAAAATPPVTDPYAVYYTGLNAVSCNPFDDVTACLSVGYTSGAAAAHSTGSTYAYPVYVPLIERAS